MDNETRHRGLHGPLPDTRNLNWGFIDNPGTPLLANHAHAISDEPCSVASIPTLRCRCSSNLPEQMVPRHCSKDLWHGLWLPQKLNRFNSTVSAAAISRTATRFPPARNTRLLYFLSRLFLTSMINSRFIRIQIVLTMAN